MIIMKETKARSMMKSLSWRMTATLTTIILVLIFTGKLELAVAIGFFEIIVKLIVYYSHERIWDKVKFGLIG